jgi:hypothetical protein
MSLELISTDSLKTSLYSTTSSYDFDDPKIKICNPKMYSPLTLILSKSKRCFLPMKSSFILNMNIDFEY